MFDIVETETETETSKKAFERGYDDCINVVACSPWKGFEKAYLAGFEQAEKDKNNG